MELALDALIRLVENYFTAHRTNSAYCIAVHFITRVVTKESYINALKSLPLEEDGKEALSILNVLRIRMALIPSTLSIQSCSVL